MLLLDYTNYDQTTIRENFGAPEYSYWFVRNAFKHILESAGTRVEIKRPEQEVDELYRAAQAMAFLEGRDFCVPEDFKPLAVPVFAHRVVVRKPKPYSRIAGQAPMISEMMMPPRMQSTEIADNRVIQ